MARITKSTVPWPPETHDNHRLVVYKIERVTVNLLTLLNEAGEKNYEPYESLLPSIRRRLTEAQAAAVEMTYFAPTGGRGKPPLWVTLIVKVIDSTDSMLSALDKIETNVPKHLFDTVIAITEVMLDDCLELLEGFKRVPLANDDDEDNNGAVLYLLDLSYLKK